MRTAERTKAWARAGRVSKESWRERKIGAVTSKGGEWGRGEERLLIYITVDYVYFSGSMKNKNLSE